EEHARLARELAVGLRHVGRAAFLATDDEPEPILDVEQAIEKRQVALARNAERHAGALRHERVGEDPAAVADREVGFHGLPFDTCANARFSASQHRATATLAVSSTPPKRMNPCTMSSNSTYWAAPPSATSRSANARPSSRSGSNPAVSTSASGRPARLPASSGDARQSCQSSRRGR